MHIKFQCEKLSVRVQPNDPKDNKVEDAPETTRRLSRWAIFGTEPITAGSCGLFGTVPAHGSPQRWGLITTACMQTIFIYRLVVGYMPLGWRENRFRFSLCSNEFCHYHFRSADITGQINRWENTMSKRDDLIAKYADDLKNKCGMTPDMDLLTKVTIGCGPSIYNDDASTVAGSQASELETVKNNFLMKKLGLADSPQLMDGINSVIETYGKSERSKYRAVVYYMLTKHFGKESTYG
jgi:hypothetical protein